MLRFGLLNPDDPLRRDYWLGETGATRIEIELGCGDCGFLRRAAAEASRTVFVGFEIKPSSVAAVVAGEPLPANAQLYCLDGRWVVSHLIAPASIDAYHTYFPDPWWKKRHHKRRLFNDEFCLAIRRTLVPDGCVYFLTDVASQASEVTERMEAHGFHASDWARDPDAQAQSSYERKYRLQGRAIHGRRFRLAL